ncbi:MAG: NAD(P)-dependent alcohol dehydrogenase [Acidiferrobacterales bacterium]
MKAVVYTRYGPPEVLQLKDIDKPEPNKNEILVKVHATTVNRTDNATIKAIPFFARLVTGLFKPKRTTPGTEFAGVVKAAGADVSSLHVGDRVFGFDDQGSKAQAEYLVIREDHAAVIPDDVSYEQAAASCEGAHYARNFINKVDIQPGQYLLVYGASGAIGSAMVQLLKAMDVNVTAVCGTRNVELVRSLGADKVIDYTQEDFTSDPQQYDYVFDAVGKISFFQCRHLLKRGGAYISSDLGYLAQNMYLPMVTSIIKPLLGGKRTIFPFPTDIPATLALVKKLMQEKRFTAVIDRRFTLGQIIDAYRYVEKGHKTGNVVITVN